MPLTKTRTPRSDEWSTPQWLYDRINAEYGPFTLDAAAQAWNAKCERYNDGVKPDFSEATALGNCLRCDDAGSPLLASAVALLLLGATVVFAALVFLGVI